MFNGFSDETVDFMWGIRFNNERTWFEAHKDEYLTYFYRPMKELRDELYDWFHSQRPELPLVGKVARIYRDARRLRGRGPYKDNLWLSVERPVEDWTAAPTFWFELGPENWSYGLGYYMARPVTLARLRARMEHDPRVMETLTRNLGRQDEFALTGEEYKRPKPGAPSELLEPWYRKKEFSLVHEEALGEVLFSRDMVARLEAGYEFLLPYYDYFATLDDDPDPRQP